MTFGGSRYRGGSRNKRSVPAQRIIGWIISIIIVSVSGFYAYKTGTVLGTKEARMLRAETSVLTESIDNLVFSNEELKISLQKQLRMYSDLLEKYNQDVPEPEIRIFGDLIKNKIETGHEADKLREILTATNKDWSCEDQTISRRFIIKTPTTAEGNDAVGFAGGFITVKGIGESVLDSNGKPLAWFNPDKPITLSFTYIGGENEEVVGVLPLHHSIIIDQTIYRFSVIEGERSFVNVIGIPCSYP